MHKIHKYFLNLQSIAGVFHFETQVQPKVRPKSGCHHNRNSLPNGMDWLRPRCQLACQVCAKKVLVPIWPFCLSRYAPDDFQFFFLRNRFWRVDFWSVLHRCHRFANMMLTLLNYPCWKTIVFISRYSYHFDCSTYTCSSSSFFCAIYDLWRIRILTTWRSVTCFARQCAAREQKHSKGTVRERVVRERVFHFGSAQWDDFQSWSILNPFWSISKVDPFFVSGTKSTWTLNLHCGRFKRFVRNDPFSLVHRTPLGRIIGM